MYFVNLSLPLSHSLHRDILCLVYIPILPYQDMHVRTVVF